MAEALSVAQATARFNPYGRAAEIYLEKLTVILAKCEREGTAPPAGMPAGSYGLPLACAKVTLASFQSQASGQTARALLCCSA